MPIDELMPSLRQAVIIVEQQKTLSYQATKAYIGLAINDKVTEFNTEIDSAKAKMDRYYYQLDLYAPNPTIKTLIESSKKHWTKLDEQLKKTSSKENATLVLGIQKDLLSACNTLGSELTSFGTSLIPDATSLLKKADQLTLDAYAHHRMMEEYLFYYFANHLALDKGFKGKDKALEAALKKNLIKMIDAPENSRDISELLHLVKAEWDQTLKHLETWHPNDEKYMSDLSVYSFWATDKMSKIEILYNQIAEAYSVSHLLSMASRQRATSQQLAKYFLANTYQLIPSVAKKELAANIIVFEEGLQRLKLFSPTLDILRTVETVERFWKNYKILVSDKFDEAHLYKMLEQSHIMMATCDKIAEQIEEYSEAIPIYAKLQEKVNINNRATRLLNLSGRQCMDLQRIPIYYILLCKNQGGATTKGRFIEAKEQFESTMNILEEAEINTPQIDALLTEINDLWASIETEMETQTAQDTERHNKVLEQSSILYTKMMNVNALYAIGMNELIIRKLRK